MGAVARNAAEAIITAGHKNLGFREKRATTGLYSNKRKMDRFSSSHYQLKLYMSTKENHGNSNNTWSTDNSFSVSIHMCFCVLYIHASELSLCFHWTSIRELVQIPSSWLLLLLSHNHCSSSSLVLASVILAYFHIILFVLISIWRDCVYVYLEGLFVMLHHCCFKVVGTLNCSRVYLKCFEFIFSVQCNH